MQGVDQSHTTTGDDPLFLRSAGGAQGIFNAVLLFLQLDLGRCADADHCDAAGQLRQTLVQLLTIVVAGALLDLVLDLGDTTLDRLFLASATNDRGVILGGDDLLGAAQIVDLDGFQLTTNVIADHGTRQSVRRCLAASPYGDRRSQAP